MRSMERAASPGRASHARFLRPARALSPPATTEGGSGGFTERSEARPCGRHLVSSRIDLGEVAASAGRSRSVVVGRASVNERGGWAAVYRCASALCAEYTWVHG